MKTALRQGTKVLCHGYEAVIVRQYSGDSYEIRVPGGLICTDDFEVIDKRMQTIELIKDHGENENGIWYVPGGQRCKMPELLASGENIQPSLYMLVDGYDFFAVESPGNINGSFFHVYFDMGVLPISTANKIRSLIKNNQDAIGIAFHNVNLTENLN